MLPIFYETVKKGLAFLNERYELIFVDDGSADRTFSIIKALAEENQRVKYLSFSRNFGKEAAMYAGMEHAVGDYVAIMDADLQDPPEMLAKMFDILETEPYDCVGTLRGDRKGEPMVRSFLARSFYRLISRISQTQILDGVRDFRMMRRNMVDAILRLKEKNRFSKGIFSWVGFPTKYLTYPNVQRQAGRTKWSFKKLLLYSFDGIIAFSTAPLLWVSMAGLVLFAIALIAIVWVVIKTLLWGDPVAGYPSLLCVILLLGAIQLLSIGMIGQYLSKEYMEGKNRPIYLLRESGGFGNTPK
jgi:glycosyltransferase involved in cell wall biosynthesis